MLGLTNDWIGIVHFLSAILAVLTGTVVLIAEKGTKRHRMVGYIYVATMVVLNISAFMIYKLFGGFGIFHFAAIISSVTLIAGMIPPLMRKSNNWPVHHFSWMYWSVMGLYAAFVSELLTRVPKAPFFGAVGFATLAVMLFAAIMFRRNVKNWKSKFGNWK